MSSACQVAALSDNLRAFFFNEKGFSGCSGSGCGFTNWYRSSGLSILRDKSFDITAGVSTYFLFGLELLFEFEESWVR
jgi:hypothetical protein